MAKVVDERVVKMTFDNSQFKKGVSETIDSLDKFQKKLDGVNGGKNFDDISKAASNVDLGTLESNVEKITVKFDSMAVIAISALDKITSKVMDVGANMVKSLSIDQVSAGFDKYTQKTSAVATIMSATGKSIEEVNTALEKLLWFTDETSYDFSDMVNNIAKFTNNKVPLEQSIDAIMGVALAAADAGANANEASRAMYNFSQAIGAGKVQLIDWKSIDLANMGTARFKETIMETAAELGTLVKTADGFTTAAKGSAVSVANFNSTLQEGWFTSDVLVQSLGKFSSYANKVYDVADAFDTCAEAMENTSAEGMELGEQAFKAGQQARTFMDAINATKDAVSSGWMRTFETIFGNYEEAVDLWSGLTGVLWDIFASGAERRNELLTEALTDGWQQMSSSFGVEMDAMYQSLEDTIGQTERWGKAIADVEDKDLGKIMKSGLITMEDLTNMIDNVCNSYKDLNEAQKQNGKYTTKQWVEFMNLKTKIDAGVISLDELYKRLTRMSGRENILTGIAEIYRALTEVLQPFKDAIRDIFPPKTAEEVYQLTQSFKEFAESLKLSEEAAYTIRVAVKAVLIPVKVLVAAAEVALTVIVSLVGLVWKLADALLAIPSKMNPFAAALKAIFGDERYTQIMESMHQIAVNLCTIFGQLAQVIGSIAIDIFYDLWGVIQSIGQAFSPIINAGLDLFVAALQSLANMNLDFVLTAAANALNLLDSGLEGVIQLMNGGITTVTNFIRAIDFSQPIQFIKDFVAKVRSMLEELPLFSMPDNVITGFEQFIDVLGRVGRGIVDFVNRLGPARILMLAFYFAIVQVLFSVNKVIDNVGDVVGGLSDTVSAFTDVVKGFADIGKSATNLLDTVSDTITNNFKTSKIQQTIESIAIAFAILAGSLMLLSRVDSDALIKAGIAMGSLAGGVLLVAVAMAAIERFLLGSKEMAEGFKEMGIGLMALAGAVAILAGSLYLLTTMDMTNLGEGLLALTVVILELTAAVTVMSLNSVHFTKGSLFLVSFAVSIGIVVASLGLLAAMDIRGIERNIGSLTAVIGLLVGVSIAAGRVKFGSALGLAVAIMDIVLMAKVAQKLTTVNVDDLLSVVPQYAILVGMIAALMFATSLAGPYALGAGVAMVLIAEAINIISRVIGVVGNFELSQVTQGTIVVVALLSFFVLLTALMTDISKNAGKMGTAFVMLAAAILVLGLAIDYIGSLTLAEVVKGTLAVSALMGMFAVIELASKDVKGSVPLIAMITVAITALSVVVAMLTMIPWQEVLMATAAMSVMLLSFGGAIKLASSGALSEVKISKAIGSAVLMGVFMGAAAALIVYLQNFNTTGILEVATGLAEILLAVGVAIKMVNDNNLNAATWTQVLQNLAYMGSFLVAGALVVGMLTALPASEGLLIKATALSEIMLACGASVLLVNNKFSSPTTVQEAAGKAIEIGTFIVAAAGAIALLSLIPEGEGLLIKATAVSEIMLVCAGAVLVINNRFASPSTIADATGKMAEIATFILMASTAVVALDKLTTGEDILVKATAVVEIIGVCAGAVLVINNRFASPTVITDAASKVLEMIGFVTVAVGGLVVLDHFTNAEGLIEKAEALSMVLGALALSVTLVANTIHISDIMSAVTNAVGMALYGGVLMGLVSVFGLILGSGAFDAFQTKHDVWIETLKAMLEILGVCVAVGLACAVIGLIPINLIQQGGVVLGAIAAAITGLTALFGAIEEITGGGFSSLLESGGQALIALGGAIGGFIGGIVGGFQAGVEIEQAKKLEQLGPVLSNFAETIQPFLDICDRFNENLVTEVNNLVDICNSLGSFIPDNDYEGWTNFGEAIQEFAPFIATFVKTIQDAGLSAELVGSTAALVDALLALDGAIGPMGALTDFFRDRAMNGFVERIKTFGTGMKEFLKEIEGCNTAQADAVLAVAQSLSAFEGSIQNTGDVVSFFTSHDLGAFGDRMKQFGTGMKEFMEKVIEIQNLGASQESVDTVIAIGDALSELEGTVTRQGGFVSWIIGNANIGTFGTNIRIFGEGLCDFIKDVTEAVGSNGEDFANAAIAVGEGLNALEQNLQNHGGLLSGIFGDNDLGSFGESIKTFAEGISDFADSVARFTGEELSNSLETMRGAGHDLGESFDAGLSDILDVQMPEDGQKAVADFIDAASESIRTRQVAFEGMAQTISDYISGHLESEMRSIGQMCITQIQNGINDKKQGLLNSMTSLGKSMAQTLRNSINSNSPSKEFYSIGVDIVRGLQGGVSDDSSTAGAFSAMRSLGRGMINAAKDELDIHSPSRVARDEIGTMIVEGIAYGLRDDMSAEEMAHQKAQNIISAFQQEFDNADFRLSGYTYINDLNETLYHSFDDREKDADAKLLKDQQKAQRDMQLIQKQAEKRLNDLDMYQAELKLLQENFPEETEAMKEIETNIASAEKDIAGYAKDIAQLNLDMNDAIRDNIHDAEAEAKAQHDYDIYSHNNEMYELLYHSYDEDDIDETNEKKKLEKKQEIEKAKTQRQIADLEKQADFRFEAMERAQQELKLLQENFPEEQDMIREIENNIMDSEKEIANYAKQIADLNRQMNENLKMEYTDQREAYKRFVDMQFEYQENTNRLIEAGYSEEEIMANYAERAGFDREHFNPITGKNDANWNIEEYTDTDPAEIYNDWMDARKKDADHVEKIIELYENTDPLDIYTKWHEALELHNAQIAEDTENELIITKKEKKAKSKSGSGKGSGSGSGKGKSAAADTSGLGGGFSLPEMKVPELLKPDDLLDALSSGEDNPLAKFGGTLSGILDGIINGFSDKIEYFKNLMVDMVNKGVEMVEAAVDIGSPSKVYFYIGSMMMQGLINGVLSEEDNVYDVLTNALADPTNKINDVSKSAIKVIAQNFEGTDTTIGDILSGELNEASIDSTKETTPTYEEEGNSLGTSLVDKVASAIENGKTVIGNALQTVIENAVAAAKQQATAEVKQTATIQTTAIASVKSAPTGYGGGSGSVGKGGVMDYVMGSNSNKSSRPLLTKAGERHWWLEEDANTVHSMLMHNVQSQSMFEEAIDYAIENGLVSSVMKESRTSVLAEAIQDELARREAASKKEVKQAVSGPSITFNQTNVSPKATSTSELYRQTKSALSSVSSSTKASQSTVSSSSTSASSWTQKNVSSPYGYLM